MSTNRKTFGLLVLFWCLNLWAADLRRITNEPGKKSHPAFSPDGRLVAYLKETAGKDDLWLADESGNKAFVSRADSFFWVTPREIVFGLEGKIYRRNIGEKENRFITTGEKPVACSEDRLVFVRDNHLWVTEDGGKERRITDRERSISDLAPIQGDKILAAADGDIWMIDVKNGRENPFLRMEDLEYFILLRVSPERKRLVAVCSSARCAGGGASSLFLSDVDRPKKEPIGPGDFPAWSPDGKQIAYVLEGEIWSANRDGRDKRRLITGKEYQNKEPAWSPDGKKIVFVSSRVDTNHDGFINWGDTNDLWIYPR